MTIHGCVRSHAIRMLVDQRVKGGQAMTSDAADTCLRRALFIARTYEQAEKEIAAAIERHEKKGERR